MYEALKMTMTNYRSQNGGRGSVLTLCFAISASTGVTYIGWNGKKGELGWGNSDGRWEVRSKRWQAATGASVESVYGQENPCAEASALSIALSWGEKLGDLVFFATNTEDDWFHPCEACRSWLRYSLGALEKASGVFSLNFRVSGLSQGQVNKLEVGLGKTDDEMRKALAKQ